MCGVFERSSRLSGLVPDVSEIWTAIVERKVTNSSSENDAQHFRDVIKAQCFRVWLKATSGFKCLCMHKTPCTFTQPLFF